MNVRDQLLEIVGLLNDTRVKIDALKKSPGAVHADADPLVRKVDRQVQEAIEYLQIIRGELANVRTLNAVQLELVLDALSMATLPMPGDDRKRFRELFDALDGHLVCDECGRWNYHLRTCSKRGAS